MKRTKKSNSKTSNNSNQKNKKNHNHNNAENHEENGIPNGNHLTKKQQAFVQEYLIDLNGTQAALRAGYSKDSAPVVGCENLKKPNIQQAIQEEMEKRQERTRVTQDKVVQELAKIAFSNMRSFVKWGPDKVWGSSEVTLIDSDQLTAEDAACVSEISQSPNQYGNVVKFKLHDKKAALELLGRHLGMFSDTIKNVHIGDGGGPIEHKFNFSDKSIKEAFDRLYGKEKQ